MKINSGKKSSLFSFNSEIHHSFVSICHVSRTFLWILPSTIFFNEKMNLDILRWKHTLYSNITAQFKKNCVWESSFEQRITQLQWGWFKSHLRTWKYKTYFEILPIGYITIIINALTADRRPQVHIVNVRPIESSTVFFKKAYLQSTLMVWQYYLKKYFSIYLFVMVSNIAAMRYL